MKWAGMYFAGFVILVGGVLAALWKLGILQTIETTWIVGRPGAHDSGFQ